MHALVIVADAARADSLSDALVDEHDATSVAIEDADAGTPAERAVFDEPGVAVGDAWRRARISAHFADAAAARAAEAALVALGCGIESTRLEPVEAADWVRRTQAEFAPVEAASGVWIVPSWHAPPPTARHVIRLDPGMAFGTGTHPTTRLCLAWLAAREGAGWPRALDYGTGSGILAIAAARLGARAVDAVDLDPDALGAARDNAERNRVAIRVGTPDLASGGYDVVVANILATPLTVLAPLLASHVAPGGSLVLSGILERQADALRSAYAPWLALGVDGVDDGWVCMSGSRPMA